MNWIGVITGDIVDSTQILESGKREQLLAVLQEAVAEINTHRLWGEVALEIYRGDSFQLTTLASTSLPIATIIRAALIASSTGGMRWDARLGIGIGEQAFVGKNIAESDGEAFRLSGRAFDGLSKSERMAILTPDEDFNQELKVSTAFADAIVSDWTITQATIMNKLILQQNSTQHELAAQMGKTPQTISKSAASGKLNLIIQYMSRYADKIVELENTLQ